MMFGRKRLLASAAAVPMAWHVLIGWGPVQAAVDGDAARKTASPILLNPQRDAYFGELHLHTTNSFDAYVLMGTKTTPDEAYDFASGKTITYLGQPIRRDVPLDFTAVTDHAENIGVFSQMGDPNSALARSEIGRLAREGGIANFLKIYDLIRHGAPLGENPQAVIASTWQRAITSANAHYRPGKFTTFIGYEWSASGPGNANLHRNVIFRGDKAPAPFSALDSQDPADLWAWLAKIRSQGFEALAFPHNANASNGLMYDWNQRNGRPIDEAYAQLRATNEPLLEVSQNKGTSETHPALSSTDEFANFEIYDRFLNGVTPSKPAGSYWRDALGRGLVLGGRLGVNPFKDGAVGGSDFHSGISTSSEASYGGTDRPALGGGKPDAARARMLLSSEQPRETGIPPVILSSAALTGVWAEANTREAIYAAFRRKETFATSGTRLKVRFFGGWNFGYTLQRQQQWVKSAYAQGVPMGGDLPAATSEAPRFAIEAVKDPLGGNLDRVQVVKVWLEAGQQRERVFDVAWSGGRKIDGAGKLPAVGNTVDLKTGQYANTIGAARLATVWTDPAFRPEQAAVYYLRALEIPTPRWSTLRAIAAHLPLRAGVPATIQERAWSSPIWYTPAPRG